MTRNAFAPATLAEIRPGRATDAPALADLVVIASEGLCLQTWADLAGPGETPLEVGRRRAAREEGAFSWRNALVAEREGRVVAALLGYPLPDAPAPVPGDVPPVFLPLVELEAEACGTWYVNVLAAFPGDRGQGHGSRLLEAAEAQMRRHARQGLSLIVAEGNAGARRFYRRHGFREVAERPAGPGPAEGRWLLMTRPA